MTKNNDAAVPKEKTGDSRNWYQKKRFNIPIAVFVLLAIVSSLGDEPSDETGQSSQSQEVTDTQEEAPSEQEPEANASDEEADEPVAPVVPLEIPDFSGLNLGDAYDDLQELGFVELNPQDASAEERFVLLFDNWFVCSIRPEPGTTVDSDSTIVLLSVKNSESCPNGVGQVSGGGEPVESASQEIPSGTYVVGSEIEPGFYRASRYYSRLDQNQEIIANDLVTNNGWTVVQVESTDSFIEFSGVAYPLEALPVLDPIEEGFTDGSYLVGTDVSPGTYRVSSANGRSAYAARLSCNGDIIDNELNDGSVILTVQESDCIFSISGTLEKLD